MDTRTGEIIDFEELNKKTAKEQKWFKEIPNEYIEELQGMNRIQ